MNSRCTGSERILAIDDEPVNLKLLDRMLQSSGFHNLDLVGDPRCVVEHYVACRPDLILLDLNMAYMDGYEVLEALQALGDPLMPPVVILTAQHGRDFLLRALSAGARDYLTKPFDRNELLMRVRNLLDAHLAHRLLNDQKDVLEERVRLRTDELQRTRLQVVQRLGKAAEYRDEETGHHIMRMSHTSALLTRRLGWRADQCELMLHASPMHDIGKIGIPDAILLKPGRFDPPEWEIMKTHAAIGGRLLEGDDSALMVMARDIALGHHEKWDGSGYPRGLAGADIPAAARVAAIADVFDALTSRRPYKLAWPLEDALDYIRKSRAVHFDPEVADVFLDCVPEVLDIRERFADPE